MLKDWYTLSLVRAIAKDYEIEVRSAGKVQWYLKGILRTARFYAKKDDNLK